MGAIPTVNAAAFGSAQQRKLPDAGMIRHPGVLFCANSSGVTLDQACGVQIHVKRTPPLGKDGLALTKVGAPLAKVGPALGKVGTPLAKVGPPLGKVGLTLAKVGRPFAKASPPLGEVGLTLAKVPPPLAEIAITLAKVGLRSL